MLLGPMDYTPGAMVNAGRERNFAAVFERPMSLGTRVHQLAMYVVYEARSRCWLTLRRTICANPK